ncbi:MAG: hypothetical protein A2X49_11970 [Lentisphaerae bacterium GWF2_52_8]|nr:MAG: hypothetical protein A2X49_11970 [Lentisphaerae bacterium GWF2_52_8]
MKIGCAMWRGARTGEFAVAASKLNDVEFVIVPASAMEDMEAREKFLSWLHTEADGLLIHHSQGALWTEMEEAVKSFGSSRPVISLGRAPDDWKWSNQPVSTLALAQDYLNNDGPENSRLLLELCAKAFSGLPLDSMPPPQDLPWDGIYTGKGGAVFKNYRDFLPWALEKNIFNPALPSVGILFYRSAWLAGNTEHIDALVLALRQHGSNAIPVFSSTASVDLNGRARGHARLFEDCFMENGKAIIHAGFNLRGFFLGNSSEPGVDILGKLGVPFLNGMISYRMSEEEWRANPQGVSKMVSMLVCGPEFDGVTEPLLVAAVGKRKLCGVETDFYIPIPERIEKAAARLAAWAALSSKPKSERRIAFILHNSPCASAEATVGSGSKLDTLESLARILARMRGEGYDVEVPDDGRSLIDEIMRRKAISEFRWTSAEEIVLKGGTLDLIDAARYAEWFKSFPEELRSRMEDVWGAPPGETKDGVPAAMLHEGRILVTGLRLGNALVCVQPKRGCAGARCDGQVCKILHDPNLPPPHQYVATYKWLQEEFGADCLVHVGTHGNLEFLPGKAIGLSDSCFPDICVGSMPHLYIYNADNPPEGVIAKRRGLATLVDHMQTLMTDAGLYGNLEEIERLLGEWRRAGESGDRSRAHQAEHRIYELASEARLLDELAGAKCARHSHDIPFGEFAETIHEKIFLLRNSRLPKGMHVFGEVPAGAERIEFIHSIMRHSTGDGCSLRELLAGSIAVKLGGLLDEGRAGHAAKTESLMRIENLSRRVIELVLSGSEAASEEESNALVAVGSQIERIRDINRRIDESGEIEALLSGFDGSYIPSGPSGLISRGRYDVLPSGRNFYSLDPKSAPSRAAFAVGKRLADALVERFRKDHGRVPACVALYWMSNDIMSSDGEVMGQILDLLGCEPCWDASGKVSGFRVLPRESLRRPRIDVSVRVSGITRDNFPCRIELIDEAVQAVASLDEAPEINFVRAHVLNRLAELGAGSGDSAAMRDASYRIFAARPGSFQAGVQFAVYSSAWSKEKDLAEIFLQWNGYAYGKGVYGVPAVRQLHHSLKSVELTYNKTASDETDLLGCCCYFGTHGGMSAAANAASGRETPAYYGDTREPMAPAVRTLSEEINRVVRTKLLNPKWIEGMKAHGYKGAGDIAKRIGRVYGWDAAAGAVDDWVFDSITDEFVIKDENRAWFQEHNKWAFEEIGRRMIEALERGLWRTSEERAEKLRSSYLETEGWMEDELGEFSSEVQGGSIDVMPAGGIAAWRKSLDSSLAGIELFDRSVQDTKS